MLSKLQKTIKLETNILSLFDNLSPTTYMAACEGIHDSVYDNRFRYCINYSKEEKAFYSYAFSVAKTGNAIVESEHSEIIKKGLSKNEPN